MICLMAVGFQLGYLRAGLLGHSEKYIYYILSRSLDLTKSQITLEKSDGRR